MRTTRSASSHRSISQGKPSWMGMRAGKTLSTLSITFAEGTSSASDRRSRYREQRGSFFWHLQPHRGGGRWRRLDGCSVGSGRTDGLAGCPQVRSVLKKVRSAQHRRCGQLRFSPLTGRGPYAHPHQTSGQQSREPQAVGPLKGHRLRFDHIGCGHSWDRK